MTFPFLSRGPKENAIPGTAQSWKWVCAYELQKSSAWHEISLPKSLHVGVAGERRCRTHPFSPILPELLDRSEMNLSSYRCSERNAEIFLTLCPLCKYLFDGSLLAYLYKDFSGQASMYFGNIDLVFKIAGAQSFAQQRKRNVWEVLFT